MIRFFRENKSTRDTVIGIVAVLFCISAIMGGQQSFQSPLSIGKRHIDTHRLQSQYQQLVKHYPDIDKKTLEQNLIQNSLSSLKQYAYIEKMGLKPSEKALRKALKDLLPPNTSLKTIAKEHRLNPNQLLLSISDQLAFQQLIQSIESTSIITPDQQQLHTHVFSQDRSYIDIDLSQGTYPDDPEAYRAIFEQQHLKHPKVYHYQYVDITPQSIGFSPLTESMIQDYFKDHLETYADQNYEYQIITYIPSKSETSTHKAWPSYIEEELKEFQKSHPNSRITSKTYQAKRSSLPENHKILEKLNPGQHYVLENGHVFSILSLSQKTTSQTIDPNLYSKLKENIEKEHYSHLLQSKLSEISEYAYTNPKSLQSLSDQYGLTLQTTQKNSSEDFKSVIQDHDFIDKHYISDPIPVSELHYRLIQIIDITPEKPMSYEEALNDIKTIYRHNVLYPSIVDELDQATSLQEIKLIANRYKLPIQTLSTTSMPAESIYSLTPTLNNPHPSTYNQSHWQQLQAIQYTDNSDNIEPLVQKLDSELLLSSLRNATQD